MSLERPEQEDSGSGDAGPVDGVQLKLRVPPPPVVRLRRSMVQLMVAGGAVLLAGSLTWAFVVQPGLREARRMRAEHQPGLETRGPVRPAELVTAQPASYDRLPPPRTATPATAEPPPSDDRAGAAPAPSRAFRPAAGRAGSTPADLARGSNLFFQDLETRRHEPDGPLPDPRPARTRARPDYYSPASLEAPLSPYELKAGALVPAVLLTAVDTARAGPVVAMVSQNVYDTVSGRYLLIPQGARLIGRHEGESAYGDRRAFLNWERLILPDGRSLALEAEPGVDAAGAVGVRGQVDRRLLPLLGGTLLAGAITTLGQMARDAEEGGGFFGDAGDAAAIEGSRVGGRLIDRELEVRPSIRLRPGVAMRVLITRDLILEPYPS